MSAAYFVRCSIKITKPILSLSYLLFVSTISSNIISYLSSERMELFESPLCVSSIIVSWALYNFSPSDIVFRATKSLHLLVELYYAFRDAITLCVAIDKASYFTPNNAPIIIILSITSVMLTHLSNALLCTYLEQPFSSPIPKLLITLVCALSYYYITDYGHISNLFWFDKEDAKLYISALSSTLTLLFASASFLRRCATKGDKTISSE